ncbi:hypothetical protein Jiend_20720 [Micromonospora endophytica]|nr:hypothetical protein Jiend_20720 [Micromonospora endophytica]
MLATWAVAWLLNRSTLGFELRAVGANPDAARTAGMSVTRTYVLIMVFAGALAGLGGSQMVLGTTAAALTPLVIAQIGFDGILVALLGRVKPWGWRWPRCCSARCRPAATGCSRTRASRWSWSPCSRR